MTSDRDIRDNTRAMNNMSEKMASLSKVFAQLNKNLEDLAKKEVALPTGPCRDYFCTVRSYHEHGISCSWRCACVKSQPESERFCALCKVYKCSTGDTKVSTSCGCCRRGHSGEGGQSSDASGA